MNATAYKNTDDIQASRARMWYMLVVASFPVAVAGLLSIAVFASGAVALDDGIGHNTSFATFDYPRPGDTVRQDFETSGNILEVPTAKTVYLVERSNGKFWPKKRLGSSAGRFTREQHASGGAGYKYTIELLAVDAAGVAIIDSWFAEGKKSGKYPGLTNPDDAQILAKVRVLKQ